MKIANLHGRLVIVVADRAVDVETASSGRFGADPQAAFGDWDSLKTWSATVDVAAGVEFSPVDLGPPVPSPGQVFAIGVNYAEHAAEAGYPPETAPVTFTKFASCVVGPSVEVELPTSTVDWEVELVVVIGKSAHRVVAAEAWDHVAGLMVGQDLSERRSQMVGSKPQFSLAKSFPGFGPTGPYLVTPDELRDPADLAISCELSGETMQESRTSRLIYDIPELIVRLSAVCTLRPGDLIFTGTPAGVGNRRSPQRFIAPGEVLISTIEGLGSIEQRFVAGATYTPS